jgi:hypothetical protein
MNSAINFVSVYGVNTETAKYNVNIQNILKKENEKFSICKVEDKNCLFSRAAADSRVVEIDRSSTVLQILSCSPLAHKELNKFIFVQ